MGECSSQSSVTEWVHQEFMGRDASRKIWARYIDEVVRECDFRLRGSVRRTIGPDDLAQEVFHDFFVGLRSRSFAQLLNREDVKQVLSMLIERIAIDHMRHHDTLRAGGGRVVAFSELHSAATGVLPGDLSHMAQADSFPTNESEMRRMLVSLAPELSDEKLLDLVCDRIMGFTIEETSGRKDISQRTIQRKLKLLVDRLQVRFQRFH